MTFLHLTGASPGMTLDRAQKWSNLSLSDMKWEGAGLGASIDVAFTNSGEVKKMFYETFLRSSKAFTQRFCIGFGVVLLALAGLTGGMAHAQLAGTGAISGNVQDRSGAVVAGAIVTATNIDTNAITTRTTTSAGDYNVTPLPPATYVVTVTAPGFEKYVQKNLNVRSE